MLGIGVSHIETVHAQEMVATQASVFVERVLVVQVHAFNGVAGPALFRPIDALRSHEAADTAIQRFDLQATVGTETHSFARVVDPHIEMILLFAHALVGQLDRHAHQAALFAVALGVTEFDKAQRPAAGVAVGLQRRQAEHLVVLGLNIRPRQFDRWRCVFFSAGVS